MTAFLLGLVVGLVLGFIGGLFFYARKIHKKLNNEEVTRETVNSLISERPPHGDFIVVNRVEQKMREATGDIALGDLVEE